MSTNQKLDQVYQKIREGARIDTEEALALWRGASWLEVAQLAWERRVQKISEENSSYTMFRVVNYTSVCTVGCTFCSFQRDPNGKTAYVLNEEEVLGKIEHAVSMGSDQVFFQGGVHPTLPLSYYTDMLKAIKEKYNFHIRGFSPVELMHMARLYDLSTQELLHTLKDAGLDSVPGAGAEILVERVRKVLSPEKCTTEEWATLMEECHKMELKGSANIVIGSVEEDYEVIEHLSLVRQIQDRTGGFQSFIPWTFQQQTKGFVARQVPHHEYLKLVALSRIFLDNIPNIEVSVMVLGKDIGKLALRMGANDISSPVIEENVLKSYGLKSEKQARKMITEAGFTPLRRDFNYNYIN